VDEYEIQTVSGPITVLLSDEDAAARGLTKAQKSRKPVKTEAVETEAVEEEKAAKPANKSRTPANKSAAKRAELAEQAFTK
jgi:hypothetical protein